LLFKVEKRMKNSEWDPLFHQNALSVIQKLGAEDLSSSFSEYAQFLTERIQGMDAWLVALPVISCLAAGGCLEDGITLASAWVPLEIASEILDNVEDKELTTNQFLTSPETATNLANGLIFHSFHTLASIPEAGKASRMTEIFSGCGLDAVNGQHRDLVQSRQKVEDFLNDYWETIILKSGSVFRAATAGGAAATGADKTITEALGDYGTALGVILQLMDDCRDAFNHSPEAIRREITLPLLLYLMSTGEELIQFPAVSSQAEWSELLQKTRVVDAIAALLLQWKSRALDSLAPLPESPEKHILEKIPSLFLERIPPVTHEVMDENDT
jgi:geranylgeranyl pyrophosphate synthase